MWESLHRGTTDRELVCSEGGTEMTSMWSGWSRLRRMNRPSATCGPTTPATGPQLSASPARWPKRSIGVTSND